jgi:omega-hydroxypalmitate O-feruloyl transferase
VHTFPHHEFAEIPDVSDTAALYGAQELLYRSFCFDPDRLKRVRELALAAHGPPRPRRCCATSVPCDA